MSTPFPQEFRDDVIRVALNRDSDVTLAQIGQDFGNQIGTLDKWKHQSRTEVGDQPGTTISDNDDLKALRKRNRLLKQENEVRRSAAAYLSQTNLPSKGSTRCETAGCRRDSRGGVVSGIKACSPTLLPLAAPATARPDLVTADHANAIFNAHQNDTEFGHRLPADETKSFGQPMAGRTAWRICHANDWFSVSGRRKARDNGLRPGPAMHDDLVQRDFTTDRSNQFWLTDITEHHTGQGTLYFCAVKDVFAGKIVGHSIDSPMTSRLALDALNNAVDLRSNVAACVVHSDRGPQFHSR